jgi:mannose-6-phosphate isomerase-like protein (cupin superfamily)
MKLGLYTIAAVLCLASPAAHAGVAPERKISSAEIERMLSAPARGTALGRLALGENGPTVVVLRRTQSGEAEVHEVFNDLFVVRSGHATVSVGGTITGQRLTAPGEWRGGAISGASKFDLGPGDVLWIPAGVPHQVEVPARGDFSYFAFKSR